MGTAASVTASASDLKQIDEDIKAKPEQKEEIVKLISIDKGASQEEAENIAKEFSESGKTATNFYTEKMQANDDEDDYGRKVLSDKDAENFGKNFGNVIKADAKRVNKKLETHNALVFDCGTGETKAIFLQYSTTGFPAAPGGEPAVKVTELRKAPATLDFLKGCNASANEDLKKKIKKHIKKMKIENPTEEDRAKANEACGGAYWFLKKPENKGQDDILKPEQFVNFCLEIKEELADAGTVPDTVMIGCSAWARDCEPRLQPKADQLVKDLSEAGILCKKLLQTQEGAYEAASIAYAYAKMCPGEKPLLGCIGSGGGSVQYMHSMLYGIFLDCGNRMCLDKMNETYTNETTLDACFEVATQYASREGATTLDGHKSRIHGEIDQEIERTCKNFPDVDEEAIRAKVGDGTVICISACYYGASSVKKANKNDNDMTKHSQQDIVKLMKEKIELDKKELKDGKHADQGDRATLFKEIANLTLQIELFESFFSPETKLCFKRNWTLNSVPFRTTWTAGWYLNYLYGMGVRFNNNADKTLKTIAEKEREARKLAGQDLGQEINQDVALVLVDLKTVIQEMRSLALKIANPVDKVLAGIANEFGGKMVGYPKFKIKGFKSLFRKLVSTIFDLLKDNEDVPSYTPNIEDCVHSIHDCLRYTLIFPPETYTNAVKAIEQAFLVGDNHRAMKIKFKNFWREKEGETTYQGINAQVELLEVMDLEPTDEPQDTTQPITEDDGFNYEIPKSTGQKIPNSAGFIFELQLHTPQSYEMKNGSGHLLYEDYRDPKKRSGKVGGIDYEGDEYKEQLYLQNKRLWDTKKGGTDEGAKLEQGDVVRIDLKATIETSGHHEWSEDDYTFKPYKPNPSIAFYKSNVSGAEWVNKLQVNKVIERKLTGKDYPFGYDT